MFHAFFTLGVLNGFSTEEKKSVNYEVSYISPSLEFLFFLNKDEIRDRYYIK